MKDSKFKIELTVLMLLMAVASTSAFEEVYKEEICMADEDPHPRPRRKLQAGIWFPFTLLGLVVLGFCCCGIVGSWDAI